MRTNPKQMTGFWAAFGKTGANLFTRVFADLQEKVGKFLATAGLGRSGGQTRCQWPVATRAKELVG